MTKADILERLNEILSVPDENPNDPTRPDLKQLRDELKRELLLYPPE